MILEGNIVCTKRGVHRAQITYNPATGLIEGVGQDLGKADYSYLGEQQLIFPGMVDIHIHAREDETQKENFKETYATASDAAINGGVAACACMPNTPSPLTSEKQLAWHQQHHSALPVTFVNYVGIGPNTKPINVSAPYKIYTGPSVGPLFFKGEKDLRKSLQHYRGQKVSFHVEDFDVLMANKDKHTHQERRPIACVEKALEYVLRFIEEFGLQAKLCHWSCGGKSFEMIAKHREKGFATELEVSPLHLFFDADMLKAKPELWPYVQMNPSLQSSQDRQELIDALKSGFIQHLATDHAPHPLDEKFHQFGSEEKYLALKKENLEECRRLSCMNACSGTPQLDTYALVCCWLINEHGFSAQRIAEMSAETPGAFINQFLPETYGKGFGKIEVGYQASFTILDLAGETPFKRSMVKSKVGWSPFEGVSFPGKIVARFIKGKQILI